MESKDAGRGTGQASGRKHRVTYGTFPEPLKGDVPYANSRPELAGVGIGEKLAPASTIPSRRS